MQLDELLAELQTRLSAVIQTRNRIGALLEAVVAVGRNLELDVVLRQTSRPQSPSLTRVTAR
jgi:hypothetical protein